MSGLVPDRLPVLLPDVLLGHLRMVEGTAKVSRALLQIELGTPGPLSRALRELTPEEAHVFVQRLADAHEGTL